MLHLPTSPQTFSEQLGLSIRYHFPVFRKMFLLIVLMVVVKDAYIYLGGMPSNPHLLAVVGIVMGLLLSYFVVAMLYLSDCVLQNKKISWLLALKAMWPRFGKVFLTLIAFVAIPFLLFTLGEWVAHSAGGSQGYPTQRVSLILTLGIGIPCLLFYLRYFYTIPFIVMENIPLFSAFKQAGKLCTKKENWVRVFGVYACGLAIWILVSPDTLHGHLMKMYKLSALFDFLVFCVTLPIMMNLIVLVRNDLVLRKKLRESE